jgi:hypothetical protein
MAQLQYFLFNFLLYPLKSLCNILVLATLGENIIQLLHRLVISPNLRHLASMLIIQLEAYRN